MDVAIAVHFSLSHNLTNQHIIAVGVGTLRQERNLIDVPNPRGQRESVHIKVQPGGPDGKTLVIPVFFLYPELATSDAVSVFVEDTTFGAHLAVMFPRDTAALSRQP